MLEPSGTDIRDSIAPTDRQTGLDRPPRASSGLRLGPSHDCFRGVKQKQGERVLIRELADTGTVTWATREASKEDALGDAKGG